MVTIDETRENGRARVGIKWGGLLISLATHPRSVAQDYPRVLPRLIQHYEYFLLVVGVNPSGAAGRASGAWQREAEKKRKRERVCERKGEAGRDEGKQKVRFVVRAGWRPVCVLYPVHTRPHVPLWRPQRETALYFSRLFVRQPKRRGQPRNSRVTQLEAIQKT